MFTKKFWKDTFERVIRTGAATAAGLLTVDAVKPIQELDFAVISGVSATSAVITFFLCLGGGTIGNPNTAGLVDPDKSR